MKWRYSILKTMFENDFEIKAENYINPFKLKKILIVESNEINLKILIEMINEIESTHLYAHSSEAALEIVENEKIDIILLALQMTEIDAFKITQRIRDKEKVSKKHIPIIAMTSYFFLSNKEKCIEAGIDDYITKPLDMDILMHILKKYLL